jgi:uncharacterized protein
MTLSKSTLFISIMLLNTSFWQLSAQTTKTLGKTHEKLIKKGKIEELKIVIQEDGILNSTFKDGTTLLHHAVINSNLEITKLLIEAGADLDIVDKDSWTALSYGCILHINNEILEVLISNNANPNLAGPHGASPLRAMMGLSDPLDQNEIIFSLLLENGANPNYSCESCCDKSLLNFAAMTQNIFFMRKLIEYDADIMHTDCNGFSTLMYAISYQDIESIEYLLSMDVAKILKDKNEKSIMQYALETENEIIIDLIKKVR